jgi:hypothetical protein
MTHAHKKREQRERDEQRKFTHGSSGATADMASDPKGSAKEHIRADEAPARPVAPVPEGQKHDQLEGREAENRQEALIDEGVEESFPASDPVSAKRIT